MGMDWDDYFHIIQNLARMKPEGEGKLPFFPPQEDTLEKMYSLKTEF